MPTLSDYGSYWLINFWKVIKAVDSSTLIIMLSYLSDYRGVLQTQNETLGLPYGASNLQDNRGLGQFLTET